MGCILRRSPSPRPAQAGLFFAVPSQGRTARHQRPRRAKVLSLRFARAARSLDYTCRCRGHLRETWGQGATLEDLAPCFYRLCHPIAFHDKKNLRVWAQRMWSRGNQHGLKFFEPSEKGHRGPLTQDKAAQLEKILDEARKEIAEVIGISADEVNLTLDLPSSAN